MPTTNANAVNTLRALRNHGAATREAPSREAQRERRLARRPVTSRTLNGC